MYRIFGKTSILKAAILRAHDNSVFAMRDRVLQMSERRGLILVSANREIFAVSKMPRYGMDFSAQA